MPPDSAPDFHPETAPETSPETGPDSPLHVALRALFKAHQLTPDDLPAELPTDRADLAALINGRVADILTITGWDRFSLPVELHIPKAVVPAAFLTDDITLVANDLTKGRVRFLRTLQQQIARDGELLSQKFRGELRALATSHAKAEHAQRLDYLRRRNKLKLAEQQESIELELLRYGRLQENAAQRSARLAAKAKLRLTRRLEWQKEQLTRKKLATQIRRNTLRLQMADEYNAELERIEREKQEGIVRIAREQKESYLAELEAETQLFYERKLESDRIEKFVLSLKEQGRLDDAKAKLAEQQARQLERETRLQNAETRKLAAEHGRELAKQSYLNKRTEVNNLRELNAARARPLGLDPKKPLTAWKAAEKRARELGLVTQLPDQSANDESSDPAVTPSPKEQTR